MKGMNSVIQKIEYDHDKFIQEMLSLTPAVMYEYAYKIFCIEEIYIILMNGYEFTEEMIERILSFRGNILEQIYYEWIHVDYSHQDAFKDIIRITFAKLPERKCFYVA